MPKISVIVPIYNVEKQLKKCLDSLVNQTYKNIQIILVNDGSTDESGKIAKRYVEQNPNKILYLEKDNGGLSDARNYGLKHVKGEYISFVDADDYITENLYSDLIKYIEEDYEIIKFKVSKVDELGNILDKNYSPLFYNKTGEEAFELLYKSDVMTEVAWAYLFKTQFFIDNDFKFAKGRYHEDFGLIPLIILKAKKVCSTDVFGYNYVQTANSITRGNSSKIYQRATDLLFHYDNMINEIKNYDVSEKSKDNIKIYYTNCILLEINNLQTKEEEKKYIKEIRRRKMTKNIKARNLKQLVKKIILALNINLYLKLR